MNPHHSKYIIIGAGLSGLTTGYTLTQSGMTDFVILESRDRIGGRILTKNGIDLGATWFQNHHDSVHQILETLGLQKFKQQTTGKSILVYNPAAAPHYFESDPSAPAASRIAGGTAALINSLAQHVSEKINVGTIASEIVKIEKGIRVITNQGVFEAEKVIITLPPKLALGLSYSPMLLENVTLAMQTTHTWMSNAIKVGLTFAKPFWREKGLSGMVMGQAGAVTELYDHSSSDEQHYALMGFVNEQLRDISAAKRKSHILKYLTRFLGENIMDYSTYEEKDWSLDTYTTQLPLTPLYQLPRYGLPAFQSWYLDDSLLFSGAETATVNGGYMDGAIRSGFNAAKQLLM